MSEALAAKLEAKILESWPDLVKSDPELLRQVVGSIMGGEDTEKDTGRHGHGDHR